MASRTLKEPLAWQNSHLIDGPLEEFVAELKQGDGGEIAVMGSISLVRQLLFGGLLDELTLMTHPVVAGSGRRLFEAGDPTTRLTAHYAQMALKLGPEVLLRILNCRRAPSPQAEVNY